MCSNTLILQLEFALDVEELILKFGRLFGFNFGNKITKFDDEPSDWQKFIAELVEDDFDKEIEDSEDTSLEKVWLV